MIDLIGGALQNWKTDMNLKLSLAEEQFVEALVASGQYTSADEVVADGIRLLVKRQHLRADIQKGIDELDAGLGVDGDAVFAELKAKAE